jgi:putative heme iron utilization protein
VTGGAPSLRELLTNERFGVLATLSARRGGWPFASLTPYALSGDGEPLLVLSDLAEHTRNLREDPRASLLVHDAAAADDPQAGARATLLGKVELVQSADVADAGKCYVERHPQSAEYLGELKDFRLYVLRVTDVRFINGFGDMGWLAADQFRATLRT